MQSPYIPEINGEGDTANFTAYPESNELPKAINPNDDPFINW